MAFKQGSDVVRLESSGGQAKQGGQRTWQWTASPVVTAYLYVWLGAAFSQEMTGPAMLDRMWFTTWGSRGRGVCVCVCVYV